MAYASSFAFAFAGNEPADEDVDIGGNEPPVSSYPSVEIEKDVDHRSSKCISAGSSSGKFYLYLSYHFVYVFVL